MIRLECQECMVQLFIYNPRRVNWAVFLDSLIGKKLLKGWHVRLSKPGPHNAKYGLPTVPLLLECLCPNCKAGRWCGMEAGRRIYHA